MYSCSCGHRKSEFWHCGGCQSDAENDDPEYDAYDCPNCGRFTEIYIDEGSHYFCELEIGNRYCIHECDGDECYFIAGPSSPPDDEGDDWHYADDYPDEIWYHCPDCDMISHRVSVDCDCEYYDGAGCWECSSCPNCQSSVSMQNLCMPLSIVLTCERDECYGSNVGDDEWPSDYYCDCCGREEVSEWDDDAEDFYCDSCEKYHDDGEEECYYYDEDDGYTDHPDSDDWYDDDEEGNANATYYIDLTDMDKTQFTYFQGNDGHTYLTVQCKSCSEPLHARVGVPNLDAFLADPFWQSEGSICPPEMFPTPLEQVDDLPNPMSTGNFDKSDFDKSDFDKSDFDKRN